MHRYLPYSSSSSSSPTASPRTVLRPPGDAPTRTRNRPGRGGPVPVPVPRDLVSPLRVKAAEPDSRLQLEATDSEDSADPSCGQAITAAQALLGQPVPEPGNQGALMQQFTACVKARKDLADAMQCASKQDAPLLQQLRQQLSHRMHMVTFRLTDDGDGPALPGNSLHPMPTPTIEPARTRSGPRPGGVDGPDEDTGDDQDPGEAIELGRVMQIVDRRNACDDRLTDAGHSRLHKLAQVLVKADVGRMWPQGLFSNLCACIGTYQQLAGAALPDDAEQASQTLSICRELARQVQRLFTRLAAGGFAAEGLKLADHPALLRHFQAREDACTQALARMKAATPRTDVRPHAPAPSALVLSAPGQTAAVLQAQLKLGAGFRWLAAELKSIHREQRLGQSGARGDVWEKIEAAGLGVSQIVDPDDLVEDLERQLQDSRLRMSDQLSECRERIDGQMAALLTQLKEQLTLLPAQPRDAVAQLKKARQAIDHIHTYMSALPSQYSFMGMKVAQLRSTIRVLDALRDDIREALASVRASIDPSDRSSRKAKAERTRQYRQVQQQLNKALEAQPFLDKVQDNAHIKPGSELALQIARAWQPVDAQSIEYRLKVTDPIAQIREQLTHASTSPEYIYAQLREHARQVLTLCGQLPSRPAEGLSALRLCLAHIDTIDSAITALRQRKAKVAGVRFADRHLQSPDLFPLKNAIRQAIVRIDAIIMER